jgi:hypothetical protein
MILLIEELVLRQLVAFVNADCLGCYCKQTDYCCCECESIYYKPMCYNKKKVYFVYYNDKHMLVYNVLLLVVNINQCCCCDRRDACPCDDEIPCIYKFVLVVKLVVVKI